MNLASYPGSFSVRGNEPGYEASMSRALLIKQCEFTYMKHQHNHMRDTRGWSLHDLHGYCPLSYTGAAWSSAWVPSGAPHQQTVCQWDSPVLQGLWAQMLCDKLLRGTKEALYSIVTTLCCNKNIALSNCHATIEQFLSSLLVSNELNWVLFHLMNKYSNNYLGIGMSTYSINNCDN